MTIKSRFALVLRNVFCGTNDLFALSRYDLDVLLFVKIPKIFKILKKNEKISNFTKNSYLKFQLPGVDYSDSETYEDEYEEENDESSSGDQALVVNRNLDPPFINRKEVKLPTNPNGQMITIGQQRVDTSGNIDVTDDRDPFKELLGIFFYFFFKFLKFLEKF